MARADNHGFAKGSSANGTGTDDTVPGTASDATVGTGNDTAGAGAGAATSPADALERPRGSRIRAGVWSFAHAFPPSRQHCAWCGT